MLSVRFANLFFLLLFLSITSCNSSNQKNKTLSNVEIIELYNQNGNRNPDNGIISFRKDVYHFPGLKSSLYRVKVEYAKDERSFLLIRNSTDSNLFCVLPCYKYRNQECGINYTSNFSLYPLNHYLNTVLPSHCSISTLDSIVKIWRAQSYEEEIDFTNSVYLERIKTVRQLDSLKVISTFYYPQNETYLKGKILDSNFYCYSVKNRLESIEYWRDIENKQQMIFHMQW
jgi:hypothetical protein